MILTDEVVFVSGFGPGLGRQLSLRAAAEGAKVIMASRSTEHSEKAQSEIAEAGGEALAVSCDVRDPDAIAAAVAAGVERFGPITGLVNSAFSHPGFDDLLGTSEKQFRRALDITLFGTLNVTRAVVEQMKQTGRGSIVNVGTMATRKPLRGEGAYAVTKAAVSMATSYLALELGEHGIRVNQAVLGWLDGPGVRFYLQMTSQQRGITEQEVYDEIAARNPLGHIPTDAACAGAILYLLSPYASEVTGATLDVNGGEFLPT